MSGMKFCKYLSQVNNENIVRLVNFAIYEV